MGIVEGFSNIILEEEEVNTDIMALDKKEMTITVMIVIAARLFMIFLVLMLWPRIMPQLFTNVIAKPSYIQLIGLSIIISLL